MRHHILIAVLLAAAAPAIAAAPAYKVTKSVPLGAPDGWDYVSYEPGSHRVYVAHSNEITVVDSATGEVVGRVQGISGVNGVAVIPALGKGYTDSRAKKAAVAFDLKTFKVTKEIPADVDTDGVVYEAASKRVFVVNGDAANATIIDAATDTAVTNLALGGKPEFLVSDDAGHVYINITDKKEIVRVDARAAKVDARWPIPDCEGAHGLAMDKQAHRLFSSCANSKMVVVDADKGTELASLPIGKGTDGAGFDPKRKLAFSSNGEGTVSVIAERAPDKFEALGEIPSRPFARTMAVDPDTGRIFLVTADLDEINPKAENLRQRYQIRRGTVQLLFLDPQ
ncbi:MAG: YncE family protein [Rhodospirillaceae bacterium]|nr:YncE family protein [Rhodospirillaceae bacterium]